jgi:hypothetical protein
MINGLRGEVMVHFVDIGGIIDHCLIVLFISIKIFILFGAIVVLIVW